MFNRLKISISPIDIHCGWKEGLVLVDAQEFVFIDANNLDLTWKFVLIWSIYWPVHKDNIEKYCYKHNF